MRYDGYFDKVLVTKESDDILWVLYQINVSRPHLNDVTDSIVCASCGMDAESIVKIARKGSCISVYGYSTNVRLTDIDFVRRDKNVFVCGIIDIEPPIAPSDEIVDSALKELLLDYYNKTE